MFLIEQQEKNPDEEKEEESPDISDEASDESDSEDSENSEQPQLPAEEKQETEVESRDVKLDTADLGSEGGSDELESASSSSVPVQQCVEEMETVSIGGSSQSRLLADHGIFGGSRAHQGNRAGPLITEIIMDTGNKLIRMKSAVLRVENGRRNDYILFPFST